MTRRTRSQIDRDIFMIADTSLQNDQNQSFSDQDIQILDAENNFYIDLDENVVDSDEQRAINDAQTKSQRNADNVANDASRMTADVVTNEAFVIASILSSRISSVKISVMRIMNVFSESIIRYLSRMSNARVTKTIDTANFAL
jgi:hypothetical protein